MGSARDSIGCLVMSEISPIRLLIKTLFLFVVVNVVFAFVSPRGSIGSGYNFVFPGRTRFPFGAQNDPYSLSVDYMDAMFASHLVAAPKASDEYRVVLIGDSSIWGEGLRANEIISEQWNKMSVKCGDKNMRAYDLGYPHPSVVKDLVIMNKALDYEPDFIVWFITLNALISERINPFLDANREEALTILNTYNISFKQEGKLDQAQPELYRKSLIGRRSNLARQAKLQALGIIWTATGADKKASAKTKPPDFSVSDNPLYRGMDASGNITDLLQLDALESGIDVADSIPLLIVNEPVFVAPEKYSTVRYNAAYPRWAYDQYRAALAAQAQSSGWNYLDLWNTIPREYFLDAGVHLSRDGERLLVQQIIPELQSIVCNAKP